MKKIKSIQSLWLAVLVFVSACLIIFLAQPLDAKTTYSDRMIELGLIDGVKTPQELHLDYLQETPPQLDVAIMESVRLADAEAAQLPEYGLVGIPLGSSGPVAVTSETPTLRFAQNQPGRFVAIASGNRSTGTINPITVNNVRDMFAIEKRVGGFGGLSQAKPEEQIIADASGNFLQARRVYISDILVLDRQTGHNS